jgi:hypothetical protein
MTQPKSIVKSATRSLPEGQTHLKVKEILLSGKNPVASIIGGRKRKSTFSAKTAPPRRQKPQPPCLPHSPLPTSPLPPLPAD